MAPFQPEEDAAQMRQQSGISKVKEVPRDTQFLVHSNVAVTPTVVGNFERMAMVKFDMGWNSIAEYGFLSWNTKERVLPKTSSY